MSLNVYGAMKLARVLAQKSGLSIKLEEKNMPRTDGHTLYLQRPSELWDKDKWVAWWGYFYHEVGHNDPAMRDIFTLMQDKQLDMQSFFGAGINIIDDHRQEHYRIDEYIGRKMALSASHAQCLEGQLTHAQIGQDTTSMERQAMETMLAFDTHCRQSWMPAVSGYADDISRLLTTQSLEWYQQLKDRMDEFDLKNPTTAEDEYALWKKIQEEIFGFDADEKEQESEQQKQEKGEGDGEDGEGKDKRQTGGTVKYDDLLKHQHDDEQSGATYAPLHIEYDKVGHDEWRIKPPNLLDYSDGRGCSRDSYYEELIHNLDTTGRGMANTVRRLLQIRSKAKRIYGQKKGKLNSRSLHRLAVKDAPSYSERVFSQKHTSDMLDVAVTVLGDGSGSMGGDKYAHMAQSAILLNEALTTLKVPLEVLTFSDSGTQKVGLIKQFNERVSKDKLIERFVDFSNYMNGNADGEAILYAYSRLVVQRAKRKVLIVLSDGSPASMRGDSYSHTIGVVDKIQKGEEVEIYGIGIQDDNVNNIYKDRKVIYNPTELEGALIDVIKTKILK